MLLFSGGILQYTVEQGAIFSEGISLRDESYDGQGSKWDGRNVEPVPGDNNEHAVSSLNSFQIVGINRPDSSDVDFGGESYDGESIVTDPSGPVAELLTGGLGQLTDTIEGANSFTMDIGYGIGTFYKNIATFVYIYI